MGDEVYRLNSGGEAGKKLLHGLFVELVTRGEPFAVAVAGDNEDGALLAVGTGIKLMGDSWQDEPIPLYRDEKDRPRIDALDGLPQVKL